MDEQPRGYEDEAPPVYREATDDERVWQSPTTPRKFDRRVVINCPTGLVLDTDIEFEGGEQLRNVLRVVISMESPVTKGADGQSPDGKIHVYVSQFNNEIGKIVYGTAEALVGADSAG